MNPDTPVPRYLLNWKTGVGKTVAALAIARRFVEAYRSLPVRPVDQPTVFVVGFTRAVFQAEMLRRPELGFVSRADAEALARLDLLAARQPDDPHVVRQYVGLLASLRRRLTDRKRGGYFQFFGYKEFANRLFVVTRKGAAAGFNVLSLYSAKLEPDEEEVPDFVARIRRARGGPARPAQPGSPRPD